MAVEVFSRYENKFLIGQDVYDKLEERLLQHMEPDAYNQNQAFYTIANLYLDSDDNHLIRTSLMKPKYKEKLRLRAYGVPKEDDKVFLEIKKKVNGLVNKRRTVLSLQEAYRLIDTGQRPLLQSYMNRQVLSEIEYLLNRCRLKPKLYLAYDRRALFSRENRDLRITFDTNIRTRRYDLRLECGDYGDCLLDKGLRLMEIKAGNCMPVWLCRLLSEFRIYKTGFSKYGKEYEKMILSQYQMKGERNLCLKPYSMEPQLKVQYQSLMPS